MTSRKRKNKNGFVGVIVIILLTLLVLLVATSCRMEVYQPGDGDYSYLKADFAMIKTNADAHVVSFTTDDDVTLKLAAPQIIESVKADTAYRAVVYYDANENPVGEIRMLKTVGVCKPFKKTDKIVMKNDPVGWESLWVSNNRSYVNLSLKLLVGVADGDQQIGQHIIGMRMDKQTEHHAYYTLSHGQNGVPEYFTSTAYISFPVDKNLHSGDSITVKVNTYESEQEKTVVIP